MLLPNSVSAGSRLLQPLFDGETSMALKMLLHCLWNPTKKGLLWHIKNQVKFAILESTKAHMAGSKVTIRIKVKCFGSMKYLFSSTHNENLIVLNLGTT